MPGFPPENFIIGSQKCGTSSLARLLDQNPAICLSNPKEPNYYSVNHANGIEWYRSRFPEPDKILIDASTTYSMCALSDRALEIKSGRMLQIGVPARIHADVPAAKIVYVVRNPVDRLYSNYWHNVKYGYEDLSLFDAIERDPQYVHLSEYFGQLNKYLEFFPIEQILVVKFEDFIVDQQATVRMVERFIGAPTSEVRIYSHENKGRQYSKFGRFLMNNRYVKKVDRIVPATFKDFIKKRTSRDLPKLTMPEREKLNRLFLADQEALQAHFGVGYQLEERRSD